MPPNVLAGVEFKVPVTAKTDSGNRDRKFKGKVTLTSTAEQAALPDPYRFRKSDKGRHVFRGVSLASAGDQTITASSNSRQGERQLTVEPGFPATLDVSPSSANLRPTAPVVANADYAVRVDAYPQTQDFTVTATDAFGNDIGDVTDQASFTMSPDGSCTDLGACGTATTTGPHTVTAELGGAQGQAAVTVGTLDQAYLMSCRGENYDVNSNISDGCEIAQPALGRTTEATAQNLGTVTDCDDPGTTNGTLLSDYRSHANPTVPGFVGEVGSAPAWLKLHASDDSCILGGDTTILTSGGASSVDCYRLTLTWKDPGGSGMTGSRFVDVAGEDGGTIDDVDWDFPGSDDSADITFKVEKICSSEVTESVTWTINYEF